MFDSRYSAVRWVDPPIPVQIDLTQVWPTPGLPRGPLWMRTGGLGLRPVTGNLLELVATRAGSILARVQFVTTLDRHPNTEVMLVPPRSWHPVTTEDTARLATLIADFGLDPSSPEHRYDHQ